MNVNSSVRPDDGSVSLGPAMRPALERLEGRDTPAAAGTLDPTFGTAGVTDPLAGLTATSVAVYEDGRVIVAGSTAGSSGRDFAVARLTAAGVPDLTFGIAGRVAVDIASGDDVAAGVALDADGRIVVAGTSTFGGSGRFAVTRLLPNGGMDPSFGFAGRNVFNFAAGSNDTLTGLAVDPADRGIVVGGTTKGAGPFQFAVARLTLGGVFDPTFGGDGKTAFSVRPGFDDRAFGLALDPARRVVVAGYTFGGSPVIAAAYARLTPAGDLDPTFAGDGTTTVASGGGAFVDRALAVTTDAAGNVYSAGMGTAVGTPLAVVKLTAGGAPDGGFGTGGVFNAPGLGPGITTKSLVGTGVAVAADGRVVVGARDSGVGGTVLRLTPAGALDPTFNPAGSNPGRSVVGMIPDPTGLALARNGRIVLVGNAAEGGRAARLLAEPTVTPLAVGGSADGRASVYSPDPATGRSPAAPTATAAAFGATAANARVAVGDVDGDGRPDTVVVTGPGVPTRFAVVSGADNTTLLVPPTAPFAGSEDFAGGGLVAAADFDRDGRAEVVVSPDEGGGPRVTIFSLLPAGLRVRQNFLGIDDPAFRGGARVAAGDISGDGFPDLVVAAGFGGGPRVAVYQGSRLFLDREKVLSDFFAFPGEDAVTLRNGVFVAVGDLTGDRYADLVVGGGPGGAPRVTVYYGYRVSFGDVAQMQADPAANFFVAGDASDRGGVRVAATDADGDGRAELVAGSGAGSPARVRAYVGGSFGAIPVSGEPTFFQDVIPFGGAALADGVYVG